MDLEKAFERVPREVLWWALRRAGVEEQIVKVVQAMYANATTAVVSIWGKSGFSGKGWCSSGISAKSLSPLLFIVVMNALLKEFRVA